MEISSQNPNQPDNPSQNEETANRDKAIIFCLEGTLLDLDEITYAAYRHVANDLYQRDATEQSIRRAMHREPMTVLSNWVHMDDLATAVNCFFNYYNKNFNQQVRLYPGVEQTLRILCDQGYQLGAISFERFEAVKNIFKLFPVLEDVMDVAVTKEDLGSKTRLDVFPVQFAIGLFDPRPASITYVGNSYKDVINGRKAGAKTVAVRWTHESQDVIEKYTPDHWISSFAEILPIVGCAELPQKAE